MADDCEMLRLQDGTWVWAPPPTAAAKTEPPDPAVRPTTAQLRTCGFGGSEWIPAAASSPGTPTNLLLLLHGLGDAPAPYATFARRIALPQTAALALRAPLPLPFGLEGGAWHVSFDADGESIDGSASGERRRVDSLASASRPRLLALLAVLATCGWPTHRVFLFGFAQGGTAALDLLQHTPSRFGGVVSWCGHLLPEAAAAAAGGVRATADSAVSASAQTPLLLVCGAEDPVIPEAAARTLFEAVVSARGRAALQPELSAQLRVLPGRGGGMVSGADEARLLMNFFSQHLSLSSALERDPSVVRVHDAEAVGRAQARFGSQFGGGEG